MNDLRIAFTVFAPRSTHIHLPRIILEMKQEHVRLDSRLNVIVIILLSLTFAALTIYLTRNTLFQHCSTPADSLRRISEDALTKSFLDHRYILLCIGFTYRVH